LRGAGMVLLEIPNVHPLKARSRAGVWGGCIGRERAPGAGVARASRGLGAEGGPRGRGIHQTQLNTNTTCGRGRESAWSRPVAADRPGGPKVLAPREAWHDRIKARAGAEIACPEAVRAGLNLNQHAGAHS
jgi:hypothetical protein